MAAEAPLGVVLLQLGTPAAPTAAALRRYLAEFLADRRVVDYPRALWWPILHGIVLRTRPRKSAALYRKIWTAEGSPLAVTTGVQARALECRLQASLSRAVRVVVGMRYGEPSIRRAVDELAAAGVDRVLAFPMYPQYSSATTGSSLERLYEEIGRRRVVWSVRVVPPYYDDAGYVGALVAVARTSFGRLSEPPDQVLLSFHGLPERYAREGDPYPGHCAATASALARALSLDADRVSLVYQSRFGPEAWLQPYLDRTLAALGATGARVAVMCPGFTADCLETLEEVALRGAEQFREAGGRCYLPIPCLNRHPLWIDAMTALAVRELSGW